MANGWRRGFSMLVALAFLPAVSSGCAAQSPVATAPAVRLTADIAEYSPLMSSAFGIHISAAGPDGQPVEGDWTATWGQFCMAARDGAGWKISEPGQEWEGASDIWWQFSPELPINGEMPSAVSIWFNGGGGSATLLLEKAGPMTLRVSGTDTAQR
jgi:hypothetical protein